MVPRARSAAAPALRRLAPADANPSQDQPYASTEALYRDQWSWDRVVKGTCNQADCIAACTLNLFVKDGIVWREEQNAIYEASGDHLPDFNPRGCQKGMVYADLMYDATRIKYPMRRVGPRGSGTWERISWEEALTQIADKVLDVVGSDGPEAIVYDMGTTNIDFGPGTPAQFRLTQLIGTTSLDEWASVGDLPMGAIQTWGLFNADGTSDDYCNSDYIMIWLGNPAYTRIPDAHFMLEARYRGAQVVLVAPDYNPTAMHADVWVNLRTATDAAFALGMAKVMVDERLYKAEYVREQTDLPFLVRDDDGRFLRQSDVTDGGSEEIFYIWDAATESLKEAPGTHGQATASIALGDLRPALEGAHEVALRDGSSVTVRAVWERLQTLLRDYTPERVQALTGVHADTVRDVARGYAKANAASIFASWGACKHYHMDLFQRSMILISALAGHTGKQGGGLRIGAWWNMPLNYDKGQLAMIGQAPAAGQRPKVRDVENVMKTMAPKMSSSAPTMAWLYGHDAGYRTLVDNMAFHDPGLPRTVSAYAKESFDNGWMPIGPKPRVLLYTGMNPLRRWPAPHVIRENLWNDLELIVTWEFRMSSSAMQSDIILPAAGWHEKAGIKFTQSLVPYICVGETAVDPLYESLPEFDIMARLARCIQDRARQREETPYVDALGMTHDLAHVYDDWSINGEFQEGDATKALDVSVSMSQPLSGTSWSEIAEKGAIHVKSTGSYGPITAICSDLEDGEALAPLKWFVEGKEPWPTLTGRQQFYLDHPWYLEAGEGLPVHKENPNGGGDYPIEVTGGHTRHSIHAIFRANKTLLNLQRGEPVLYMSERDALDRDIHDHDSVRVFNDVGSYVVHVKPSASVQPGQAIIYHAWEPYQFEGWNSSQNIVAGAFKPLHLLGGYGQFGYRPILGQPSHTPRAQKVQIERVPVTNLNGGA
ncbi:MAG TPA: molybdopterin-dependent oxidoreductase [Dehalococcoidia bacterium]|nr:molybdopterin-dependent oxidoreductase [Dehalococcoidia bacterium]